MYVLCIFLDSLIRQSSVHTSILCAGVESVDADQAILGATITLPVLPTTLAVGKVVLLVVTALSSSSFILDITTSSTPLDSITAVVSDRSPSLLSSVFSAVCLQHKSTI